MEKEQATALAKVPAVAISFWAIKILATTLGETAGDSVSMSCLGETTAKPPISFWQGGYLLGTAIFVAVLAILVVVQIRAKWFHPWLYWAPIIASITAGTTITDFATRSLGIGYSGGSILLFVLIVGSLLVLYHALGTISVSSLYEPRAGLFHWVTITASQTLDKALGDWIADGPLGYLGSALIFGSFLGSVDVAATDARCYGQFQWSRCASTV